MGNRTTIEIYEGGVYVNIANDAVTDFRVDTSGATDAQVDASADTAEFNVNVLPFNIQQQTTGAAGLTITIDDDGATTSPDLKLFHNSTTLLPMMIGHIPFKVKTPHCNRFLRRCLCRHFRPY